jgi:hypothetical protein
MNRFLEVPSFIVGGSVCFLNMTNIKRSPQYSTPIGLSDMVRFTSLSIIKGTIYGFFWPFALIGIALDIPNKQAFDSHFIPFSKCKV